MTAFKKNVLSESQVEERIKEYLANETQLYEDWYQGDQYQLGSHIQLYGPSPPIEFLKVKFKEWVDKNKTQLKEEICLKWKYSTKKDNGPITLLIIAVIADCLTPLFKDAPNLIAMGTALVVGNFLDEICIDESVAI